MSLQLEWLNETETKTTGTISDSGKARKIDEWFSRPHCLPVGNFLSNDVPNEKQIPVLYRWKSGWNSMDIFLYHKSTPKCWIMNAAGKWVLFWKTDACFHRIETKKKIVHWKNKELSKLFLPMSRTKKETFLFGLF